MIHASKAFLHPEQWRFCPSMVSKRHASSDVSIQKTCTIFSHSNKLHNLNEILNTSMMNSQLFIKAMNSATAWLSEYIKLRDMWEKLNNSLDNPIHSLSYIRVIDEYGF